MQDIDPIIFQVLLTLGNFIIGFYVIKFIRSKDIYHPEPYSHMFLFFLCGGILSVSLTFGSILFLNRFDLYTEPSILNFFLFTGPIEEISKFAAFWVILKAFKIKLDEPVDALIYVACTALGFSLIENFMYAQKSGLLIFVRLYSATVVHITLSCIIGLAYSNYEKTKNSTNIICAIFIAILIHGAYDAAVTIGLMNSIIILLFYYFALKMMSYLALRSPHYVTLEKVVELPETQKNKLCMTCHTENLHHSINVFNQFNLDECKVCKSIYIPEKKILKFYQLFVPGFDVYGKNKDKWLDLLNSNFKSVHDEKFNTYKQFKATEASPTFEIIATEIKSEFEKSNFFKFIFGD